MERESEKERETRVERVGGSSEWKMVKKKTEGVEEREGEENGSE